jgi:hypothetical protein
LDLSRIDKAPRGLICTPPRALAADGAVMPERLLAEEEGTAADVVELAADVL